MSKNKIKLSTVTILKMIPLAVYIQNMVTFSMYCSYILFPYCQFGKLFAYGPLFLQQKSIVQILLHEKDLPLSGNSTITNMVLRGRGTEH